MLSAIGTNGQTQSYIYDADGRRTRRILNNSGETWWQVFGVGGEMVAEYQLVSGAPALRKEYGHRNGQLLVIADATNNTCQWLVTDALGTPRIIADQTGSLSAIKRHDYLPFGEEVFANVGHRATTNGYVANSLTTQPPRQQFTGKDRDNETGLDYFEARYFSATMGRFTSPDEFTGGPDELYDFAAVASGNPTFYADVADPQSLNKYVYVFNNPLVYVDPDGHQAALKYYAKLAIDTVVDYGSGVAKGALASVTYGLVSQYQPKASDSIVNRIGQGVGTLAVGYIGIKAAAGGTAVTVLTGGTTAVVATPVAVVGAVAAVGAAKNLGAVLTTPMQASGRTVSNGQRPKDSVRKEVYEENRQKNGGTLKCEECGVEMVPGQKSQKGVKPPPNEASIDHITPVSQGGTSEKENLRGVCRRCNRDLGDKKPE
jgi:RHS repeat-associated protein